jgi:hypothetical protein
MNFEALNPSAIVQRRLQTLVIGPKRAVPQVARSLSKRRSTAELRLRKCATI